MSPGPESIDRQRWLELKALFGDIVERPVDEWAAAVDGVRARDPEMADHLQRLLDGHLAEMIPSGTIRLDHLPPGTRLGPYVISGLIGEGGMGRVYRATDQRLGREVAIKVLPPGLLHDADRRARMEREARAMGMLNHPNVVTVYDIGDHHGSPFIVSELLEGRTLREHASTAAGLSGHLDARAAVDIVVAMADALGAAHGRGIVHRDIKPENVFVTSDGRVKVLDFGIAKLVGGETHGDNTATGAIIGTPGYMSPEQLRGEPAGAATDVYACGVVLHELLSGGRLYAGKSQAALIGAILHEPPPPLPRVDPRLAALVARCLDKRADDRFADGAELASALRILSASDLTTATATRSKAFPAILGSWKKTATSRPMRLVVPVTALVASVAVGALVWRSAGDDASLERRDDRPVVDVVLPVPSPLATSAPAQPDSSSPSSIDVAATPPPPREGAKPAVEESRESTVAEPAHSPTQPPSPAIVASLDGVWLVSEQLVEDAQAIECEASGALQLKFDDGLLDGALRLERNCRDLKRKTTDSTETTSALTVGTMAGDEISFVSRVVDDGLATTCRYAGRIVGSSRGTMAGEVACEARSVGVTAVLALHGTWRANRASP